MELQVYHCDPAGTMLSWLQTQPGSDVELRAPWQHGPASFFQNSALPQCLFCAGSWQLAGWHLCARGSTHTRWLPACALVSA